MKLTPENILSIQRMVYGEAAGSSPDVMKMIAQTAINRFRSGRSKEFGGDINTVLRKGYYAVSNPNNPYKQAVNGKFNDPLSAKKWELAKNIVNDVVSNNDFGNAMFYFTPSEIEKQKASKSFNFNAVVPLGQVGPYQTFGYKMKTSHYGKG